MPEKKVFVVDTSVLIHDPSAITQFEDNDVILPYVVLHELDGLRKAPNGRGLAAREAIRKIENLTDGFKRIENIPLGEELGLFSVSTEGMNTEETDIGALQKSTRDDLVIRCASVLGKTRENVIVVSKDVGLRLKAMTALWDVEAQDYLKSKIDSHNSYTGLHQTDVMVTLSGLDLHSGEVLAPPDILLNEFCYVVGEDGYESCGRVLCRNKGGFLHPVASYSKGIQGVRPQDDYQRMALDVLLDQNISLVSLTGSAGAGKTILSLASGLDSLQNGEVSSIMYVKPIVPVGGRDIGYLKGDKESKLWEWVKPLFDNLRVLGMTTGKKQWDEEVMLDEGQLELEALTFMRGRTLHGYWVITDETQNCSSHEIRTALSRMGEKTKCIVLADPTQIDNPYVDAESCGAVSVIDKMKGHELFAAVPMLNSHRSKLSQAINERMT